MDDVVAARAVPLDAGATYFFDKGYTDYRWWAEIVRAKALFLTRRKKNAHRRSPAEHIAEGAAILADRTVKIGHPPNPLYEVLLREVVVEREGGREPLCLLTNDLERPAAEIARLYKERWHIELLFKWLKQNLKIRTFWGRSENAVRLQIYAALIAFMLLRILHRTAARAFTASTALLLTRLKLSLFRPLQLRPTGQAAAQAATPATAASPIPPRLPMTPSLRQNPGQQWAKAGTHARREHRHSPM